MQRGFVKIYRKVEDSGLMQNPNALVLFLHLLMRAAYKEKKIGIAGQVVSLKRGQLVTGRKSLAHDLKLSERKIRTSLELLIKLEIVTSTPTSKWSVIEVVNYDKYQSLESSTTSTPTNKRPANDQQVTTIEEGKKVKQVKNTTVVGVEADDAYADYPTSREINGNKSSTGKSLSHKPKIQVVIDKGYPFREVVRLKKKAGDAFPNLSTFLNNLPDPAELKKFGNDRPANQECHPTKHVLGPLIKGGFGKKDTKKCTLCPRVETIYS